MSLSRNHYVSIKNGEFDSTTNNDLDDMFTKLASDEHHDTIVVYLHGGLVNEENAKKTAEETLLKLYRDAGAYPIFFFWQSGLLDVVTGNLSQIFDEKIFQRLLTRVVQFTKAKLGQTTDARGELLEIDSVFDVQEELKEFEGNEPYQQWRSEHMPDDAQLLPVEEHQFKSVLEADVILSNQAQKIANGLRTAEQIAADEQERSGTIRASTHTLMSPSVLQAIAKEAHTDDLRGSMTTLRLTTGAIAVLGRVIKRFANGRDHGVYLTVIEELLHEFYLANIGQWGWELMKGDAADAFNPDASKYGGTAFLEKLKTYWEQGNDARILLVGHSAGSIFICHFLQAAAAMLPAEIQFDVVFLAPGCTFELLAETLDKAPERIRNIRLFSMKDEGEKKDQLLGLVFPRSILYLVSGVLEDEPDKPLVGMHRFFNPKPPFDLSSYPEVARVRQFFNSVPEHTVWSVEDSGPGRASFAADHGAFDDKDCHTLLSLHHIITKGF